MCIFVKLSPIDYMIELNNMKVDDICKISKSLKDVYVNLNKYDAFT